MKKFAIFILSLSCFEASAAYDCTATFFTPDGKKPAESKIELKPEKKDPQLFSTEKDGYKFEILRNEADHDQIEKLIVTEIATTREAVTSFVGWKALKPNTLFMNALIEGDIYHRKGVRMICTIKPD